MVARRGWISAPWLHSSRIRGGVTQLPGDATAVIGCWSWVKRAFILPILGPRRDQTCDHLIKSQMV